MATVEEAIALWRTRRENVSDHRETNIEAWIVELQGTLEDGPHRRGLECLSGKTFALGWGLNTRLFGRPRIV